MQMVRISNGLAGCGVLCFLVTVGCSDDEKPKTEGSGGMSASGGVVSSSGGAVMTSGGKAGSSGGADVTGSGGSSEGGDGGANPSGSGGAASGGSSSTTGGTTLGSGGASTGSGGSSGAAAVLTVPSGVTFVTSGVSTLRLVSSNLTQSTTGSSSFQEWFAEVANDGTSPACFAKAAVTFLSSTNATVIGFTSYADAPPYASASSTLSVPCIPAGKTAGFYSNALGAAIDLTSIRSASVQFTTLSGTYSPHPSTPTMTAAVTVNSTLGSGYWSVSGNLTAVKSISNIGVTAFPRSSAGLLVDQLTDVNLGSLLAGQVWAYEAEFYKGPQFSTFLESVDFIDGAAYRIGPSSEIDQAAAQRDALRRELGARRGAARAQ
ncbi:MAG: hypothetical protein QM756_06330 [Polyangiaceae bacterium]